MKTIQGVQQNVTMSVFPTGGMNNRTIEGMKSEGTNDNVKSLAASFLTYRISKFLPLANEDVELR